MCKTNVISLVKDTKKFLSLDIKPKFRLREDVIAYCELDDVASCDAYTSIRDMVYDEVSCIISYLVRTPYCFDDYIPERSLKKIWQRQRSVRISFEKYDSINNKELENVLKKHFSGNIIIDSVEDMYPANVENKVLIRNIDAYGPLIDSGLVADK